MGGPPDRVYEGHGASMGAHSSTLDRILTRGRRPGVWHDFQMNRVVAAAGSYCNFIQIISDLW